MPKPYVPNDKWSQRAAAEGYRARSVYKLMELDVKFRLLKPGMTVVDIGAAPGSWLQYVSERVGMHGKAVGFDLQAIAPVEKNVRTHVLDVNDTQMLLDILEREGASHPDLVLSDIAPSTTGIKDVDQWESVRLAQAVLEIGRALLSKGGRCVVKIFRGSDFDAFLVETKQAWHDVRIATAHASRDRSREVYIVATK